MRLDHAATQQCELKEKIVETITHQN